MHSMFTVHKNISMYECLSRTGLLGFLSDETKSLPGNLGLADLGLALDWVQQAIAEFGGNPNSVTMAVARALSWLTFCLSTLRPPVSFTKVCSCEFHVFSLIFQISSTS